MDVARRHAIPLDVIVNGFRNASDEPDIKDDLIVAKFCQALNRHHLRVGSQGESALQIQKVQLQVVCRQQVFQKRDQLELQLVLLQHLRTKMIWEQMGWRWGYMTLDAHESKQQRKVHAVRPQVRQVLLRQTKGEMSGKSFVKPLMVGSRMTLDSVANAGTRIQTYIVPQMIIV
jgi:hypothetical protein